MQSEIIFEQVDHLGLITLNRGPALNALTFSMIQDLSKQLQLWDADPKVQAVVIQASAGKAFCAGGDVRWLYEAGRENALLALPFFWHEYRLNYAIHQFSKPYIALMDGITMGGGVGISLHGSFPIASDRFVFAMPETSIGLFPDIGASYLLSRLEGEIGLYLALTGRRLEAADAKQLGLVKYVLDQETMSGLLPQLTALDLSKDAAKRLDAFFAERALTGLKPKLLAEREPIHHFFKKDSLKSLLLELATSYDTWALDTLDVLEKCSPLSLAITFEQIKRALSLSLAECLQMDYRLVNHFMQAPDFYEGIRAALIDKDKNPHWQPDNTDEVTEQMVAAYFESEEELILEEVFHV